MKKLLPILLIVLFSCKKDNPVNRPAVTSEPQVTNVRFFSIQEAGDFHPAFDVDVICDSNTVSKLLLYMSPNTIRWEVKKPSTGTYRMYDHIGLFPTYAQSRFYFLQFVKNDGTIINLKEFQVY